MGGVSCGQCLWYCMAKCYKYRVKENEVNIHQILLTEKAHKHALYNVLLGEVLCGWQHLLIELELFGQHSSSFQLRSYLLLMKPDKVISS